MLRSGVPIYLKDTYQTNYIKLIKPFVSTTYYPTRVSTLDTTDLTQQFIIEVIRSVSNNPEFVFIGDTIRIKSAVQDTYPVYADVNFLFLPQVDTTNVLQYVVCTKTSYCNAANDKPCKNPVESNDYGKPVCLTTNVYLYGILAPSGDSYGYVEEDYKSSTYYLSTDYAQPQDGLASFYFVPSTITYCQSNVCQPFTDYNNIPLITCSDICNCKDKDSNLIFGNTTDCNCNSNNVTKYYGCCPKSGCVETKDTKGMDYDTCNAKCTASTQFACENGVCVPSDKGTYKDQNCGGNCTAVVKCGGKNTTVILIAVITVVIIFIGVIYLYRKFRHKKKN